MISTAEGVETQQQLDQLQTIGCTEMQGYLFSRARPAQEIVSMFLGAEDSGRTTADGGRRSDDPVLRPPRR
jgi:EAL domain-containing protein (putative c-di-GMP-specific phosphodiesterase class I)